MFRLKLDLGAFSQCFQTPFWEFERHGIRQSTILEYAQSVLAKYGVSEKYPTIYLEDAIIPHNQSPEIVRDGDLLRFVPCQRNLAGAGPSQVVQAVTPYSQIPHTENFVGGCTDANVTTAVTVRQPTTPPNNTTIIQSQAVRPTYNYTHQVYTAESTEERRNSGAESSEDAGCENEETTLGSEKRRKRRKRGPRRRIRSKRTVVDLHSRIGQVDASTMNTISLAQNTNTERPQIEKQNDVFHSRGIISSKSEILTGNIGLSSRRGIRQSPENCSTDESPTEQNLDQNSLVSIYDTAQGDAKDVLGHISSLKASKSFNKSDEEEMALSFKSDEQQNAPKVVSDTGNNEGSFVHKASSKTKPSTKKVSVRKAAKRSHGVGDLLRMLQSDGSCNNQSRNKIASNTTTLCQSNYSHAEQHIESNTIDLPESQSIEFRSTEDNSINSPQSKTVLTAATMLKPEVRLEDIRVGSLLVAGVSLFSEADMSVRFFNDVTLSVMHLNVAKKQVYVKLEKGLLPVEYRDYSFKIEWSLLENVRLLSAPDLHSPK